jgi:hypothetical protein
MGAEREARRGVAEGGDDEHRVLRCVQVQPVVGRAVGHVAERAARPEVGGALPGQRPVQRGDEPLELEPVVAAQQRVVAGDERGRRVDLGVPVDLVEHHGGPAPLRPVRAPVDGRGDRAGGRVGQPQCCPGAPGEREPLGDLRVDREVVGPGGAEQRAPADRGGERGGRGARHRAGHQRPHEAPRPGVGARRAVVPAERRSGVDEQEVRVRAGRGGLAGHGVRAGPGVPAGRAAGDDGVGDGEVVAGGERGCGGEVVEGRVRGGRAGEGAGREPGGE